MISLIKKPIPFSEKFYEDLRKFRKKYRMCYVETWTPEDFRDEIVTGIENAGQVNWESPGHIETADALYDSFNAEYGTNWDSLCECIGNDGHSPNQNQTTQTI